MSSPDARDMLVGLAVLAAGIAALSLYLWAANRILNRRGRP